MNDASDTVRVCEIFYSIQGESTFMGRPCVFVRLAGCDVGCRWCDTRYAVDDPGRAISMDAAVAAVDAYGIGLVEITGGEPLAQSAAPHLAMALVRAGYAVLVETSGTRDIRVLPPPVVRIVDVKGPSSGVEDRMRWDNLSALRPTDEVKFVVADRTDYESARDVFERYRLADFGGTTLFSPVAGSMDPAMLAEWLLADRMPVRLQVPLHRVLWPHEPRGR